MFSLSSFQGFWGSYSNPFSRGFFGARRSTGLLFDPNASFGNSNSLFGGDSSLKFRRRYSGLNNNIFASSNVNTNGINLKTDFAKQGNQTRSLTAIDNPFTGTQIAQLSGSNGAANFSKTMISGDDINSISRRITNINSPTFRGTSSSTRVEDSQNIYTITRTRGTGWVA